MSIILLYVHIISQELLGTYGGQENCMHSLVGKNEGEGPFGRSGHRWKDTITIFVKELGWEGMDRSIQCHDRNKRGTVVETVLGIY